VSFVVAGWSRVDAKRIAVEEFYEIVSAVASDPTGWRIQTVSVEELKELSGED
jgi:hypothetical protein